MTPNETIPTQTQTQTQPTSPQFDPVVRFLNWWKNAKPIRPPFDNTVVNFDNKVVGSVLFREGQFQVQQFIVAPHTDIADHIHPNVDSFEVYIAGQIEFRLNGERITPMEELEFNETTKTCSHFGRIVRVKPTDWHGGRFGEMGGVFFSVQHWLNDVPPSSVHLDWQFQDPTKTLRNESINELGNA